MDCILYELDLRACLTDGTIFRELHRAGGGRPSHSGPSRCRHDSVGRQCCLWLCGGVLLMHSLGAARGFIEPWHGLAKPMPLAASGPPGVKPTSCYN
jgi:hypothetical protein